MTEAPAPYRKKLIEVALPLEAISVASAREKSIRHGHPSTLHLWWSRKPLAACRAVLFSSMVDDPSSLPDLFPTEDQQDAERRRLFDIIADLVKWEKSSDESVLHAARVEIARSAARASNVELPDAMSPASVARALSEYAPPVLDPFCGGGTIPLEAQRLGLVSYASDLNPVAVLISKALVEIPPRFASHSPVNSEDRRRGVGAAWSGSTGLAADIRYYARWMRREAHRRIGQFFPPIRLPAKYGGGEAAVIAWLWARSVTCPNPACGATMPLSGTFWLSKRKGAEAWIEPVIDRSTKSVRFDVRTGIGTPTFEHGTSFVTDQGRAQRATFRCLTCGTGIARGDYIDREAGAGRLGRVPLAVVAERKRGRAYLPFDDSQLRAFDAATEFASQPRVSSHVPSEPARGTFGSNAQGRTYGFHTFADYFLPRQLVSLSTLVELVEEVRSVIEQDAGTTAFDDDPRSLGDGGIGRRAYADAVSVYLALAVNRSADRGSSICGWDVTRDTVRNTFSIQGIPMTWNFAEGNPFSDSSGNFRDAAEWIAKVVEQGPAGPAGTVSRMDATKLLRSQQAALISTDPPYYDNVSYADLSDYFYVWLRRSLERTYPDLFSTLLTPKAQELIAAPQRHHGSAVDAERFFEEGLGMAFREMRDIHHPDFPVTVYYAFKQSETKGSGGDRTGPQVVVSTGWETMLEALLGAGFMITGTLPVRSELSNRIGASDANSLGSSIVLVCRARPVAAPVVERAVFARALKHELPEAVRLLQRGNIAPVDLAQASIGPGMAIFSRFSNVLEPSGAAMRVRSALQLIIGTLEETLTEQEGQFDADTRWAVSWFEQFGSSEGNFAVAEVLSKAKNSSVSGLVEAGIVQTRPNRVRLRSREELDPDWNPATDRRPTIWEATQHLIRLLDQGEEAAAGLLSRLGDTADAGRDLAYRLYVTSERKGWAQEARAYNSLVIAWPELQRLAAEMRTSEPQQARLV